VRRIHERIQEYRVMKNFLRAMRFAWPYRYRTIFSVVCAVLAAALWGLNFTAIYPILKIIGSQKNLQTWVDASIKKSNDDIVPLQKQVEELTKREATARIEKEGRARDKELKNIAGDLLQSESKLEGARQENYRLHIAKRYIDMLFPTDPFKTLTMVLALVVLAVAVKGLFEFWQESLVGSVVNRMLFDLRNRFYRRAIRLDAQNFSEAGTSELMARFTNDMELLGTGQKTLLGKIIAEPLRALACVIFACWISWQLTLMFLVLVPFALFVLTKVGRIMKRATRRLLERMSDIYKILQETFQGIRIVKAFTNEAAERRRFRAATKEYYHKAMLVVNLDALAGPVIELLGMAAIVGALLAGAYLVLEHQTHLFGIRLTDQPMETESLLQLYALLAAISDPVRKLSNVYTRIQSGCAAADRIFAFIDREPRIQANSTGPYLERHHSSIVFQNVCFSYTPEHPILTGVNLTVKHGETIALVGKNGCGKSTLLGLLARFYDPDHGTILVDDRDLRVANLRSLRKQVALVTQETFLFDDTIANNIAYGCRHATREQVEQAARQAKAHDIITKQPNGYDTRVGEAASKLSGGQRQRIALARAILRDPSILILDEFTSAADAEAEMEVHRVLREFIKGRTTFIITHRLNTLEIADRIVVLDHGRIVAAGSHAELLHSCGVYQRLHEAQFQRLVA
jgi:ATP-binding cassette subfamily B protein/subfamily B ATP-binding cassette protein MsbA